MNNLPSNRAAQFVILGLVLALATGCAGLLPKPAPQPAFYALDGVRAEKKAVAPPLATAPTLIVNPPHAAAGFDSQRIIYVRDAHKLDYFARSEWIDTPARMLTPLIVAAIENGGAFRAVVQTPSPAAGDIRLDTEILRLQAPIGTIPAPVIETDLLGHEIKTPKPGNDRPEAAALVEVLKALRAHPTVAWCERMNSGAVRIGKRFVRFGWVGCPDVLGQLKDGRLLGVEVKANKGKLRPEQTVFLERIRCAGGVAFLARDLRDVMRELER